MKLLDTIMKRLMESAKQRTNTQPQSGTRFMKFEQLLGGRTNLRFFQRDCFCVLMFPLSFFNSATNEYASSGHRFQLPRRESIFVAAAYVVDYLVSPSLK
jgi:hypothetical protein